MQNTKQTMRVAIGVLLAGTGTAARAEGERPVTGAAQLPEVQVTASPLNATSEALIQPVTVLGGAELARRQTQTLGATVAREPGVRSSYFGPGVGRPVIRGLDGPRIGILQNGLDVLDVSAVSADHAVALEPLLVDQIEILKGPSTLLFGSGAFGGVVNAVDGRIPEGMSATGLEGAAELRHDDVSDERTAVGRLDGGSANFAWHLDGFNRRTNDYEIPGFAERDPAPEEIADGDSRRGVLKNSAIDGEGGAAGASLIGSRGFAGFSFSGYETTYGVPGGHGHLEATEEGEEAVSIALESRRLELRGGLDSPLPGFDHLRLSLVRQDYRHLELEGDEIGTRFDNEAREGRIELRHRPIADWLGALGIQYTDIDFSALGEEAFVPPSETRRYGLFWLETRQFGRLGLEAGVRHDRQEIDPNTTASIEHRAFTLSGGASYALNESWTAKLFLAHAQRMPVAEELLADGPHVATRSIEIGDPDLDEETARSIDIGLVWQQDAITAGINIFYNRIEDFIFLAETGFTEDDLPVRAWSQTDAYLYGAELDADWQFAERAGWRYSLDLGVDGVRGELIDGGNLPRIPPYRIILGLRVDGERWQAGIEAEHVAEQNRTAEFESQTDAYTWINADLVWQPRMAGDNLEIFLRGTNLTDREAREHVSQLKDISPLPGRSVAAGLRIYF